jgi:hypothetical protein
VVDLDGVYWWRDRLLFIVVLFHSYPSFSPLISYSSKGMPKVDVLQLAYVVKTPSPRASPAAETRRSLLVGPQPRRSLLSRNKQVLELQADFSYQSETGFVYDYW